MRVRWRAFLCRAGFHLLVPGAVRRILARLNAAGYAAYLVGGCVRDLLLGRRPTDWDVATDAHPEQVLDLFPVARRAGYRFGTVAVGQTEVTTFRTDGRYTDYRHPDGVTFANKLIPDLARRDFTINAMALAPGGRLIDPFGGRRDLGRRVLRAVGNPADRLSEDALRILRALRLAAELGLHLEPSLLFAIQRRRRLVRHVSAERVRAELVRLLLAPGCARALRLLATTGLLVVLLPELASVPAWDRVVDGIRRLPPDLSLRLAALCRPAGPEAAAAVLRRLRFDRASEREVRALLQQRDAPGLGRDEADLRRLAAALGRATAGRLARWRLAEDPRDAGGRRLLRLLASEDVIGLHSLAVDGNDLMRALGLPPGPEVGRLLARLLEEVWEDPARNRREVLLGRAGELARGGGLGPEEVG